ncbi:hypothetical protein E2553_20155 [Paraburkholderia dipogonis]|uniref:Uncharacterized protein n=1 Tax=Paraburkholderia dipogonis TaxID=1211383 RepID=A0A4Y8MNY9_9BURK|nr:hypothetical protein [Paraburkholderia dipogonis]TFE39179.1 hypothetical protein E2553_20155 [Paraburkholderia dipogonis]
MSVTQRIARRDVEAIIQRRDQRAIVLLRVTPNTLMRRDTIELLRELQRAYVDELQILPMIWMHDCKRADPSQGHTLAKWLRRCGIALALEASLATVTSERDVISSWFLWNEDVFPDLVGQIQTAEPLSIPANASSVGWTVASSLGTHELPSPSTEFESKAYAGLRHFFLDFSSKHGDCPTGGAHSLPEMHLDDRGALGGIVLNFIGSTETVGCRGDSARQWTVEVRETRITLDRIADAVTHGMIAAATRANRSIWRRL